MRNVLKLILAACAFCLMSSEALAQGSSNPDVTSSFIKKRYNIKGTWNITEENGQSLITFSEDFKTKGGPDLKLYLSPKTMSDLDSGSVAGTSLKLSVLKSNSGAQSYMIPADVNLSDYKSVVIHCEAFEVLWGGFDIANTP